MNIEELEDWAFRAMQALQEVVDDAQMAAGKPDAEDEALDIRGLMAEYERIARGQPAWQARISDLSDDNPDLFPEL